MVDGFALNSTPYRMTTILVATINILDRALNTELSSSLSNFTQDDIYALQ